MAAATAPATHALTRVAPIRLTDATNTTLQLESWLSATASRAYVQVITDGVTWETVHDVATSDSWTTVEVNLGAFAAGAARKKYFRRALAIKAARRNLACAVG